MSLFRVAKAPSPRVPFGRVLSISAAIALGAGLVASCSGGGGTTSNSTTSGGGGRGSGGEGGSGGGDETLTPPHVAVMIRASGSGSMPAEKLATTSSSPTSRQDRHPVPLTLPEVRRLVTEGLERQAPGKPSSASLVSCMQTMSGWTSASHDSIRS